MIFGHLDNMVFSVSRELQFIYWTVIIHIFFLTLAISEKLLLFLKSVSHLTLSLERGVELDD